MSSYSSDRSTTRPTYTSVVRLARGGMGEVTLALRKEGDFQRLYAIKRLLEPHRQDENVRTMFLDEARIAGLIRHPNVVSVLDVGEDEDGPFLIMDYVEGVSLSTLIKRVNSDGRRIPLQVVLRLTADICRGLHAAHELRAIDGSPHPVVHRDVSPQNVLLGYDGVARVTDFGVAKVLDHLVQTNSGLLKGKSGYMSPEQLRFEPLDRRSDLFSVGVVLFEMLAGRRLYTSKDDVPPARRILDEPPSDIGEERSDLPPPLVALSFRLLAKKPELRPASALDAAEQLDALRTALELDQGSVDTGKYVSELFKAQREERVEAIAAALDSLETIDLVVRRDTIELLLDSTRATKRDRPDQNSSPPRRGAEESGRQRRGLLMIATIALIVLAALGIGITVTWSLTHRSEDEGGSEAPRRSSGSVGSALITGSRLEKDGEEATDDAGSRPASSESVEESSPSEDAAETSRDVESKRVDQRRPRGRRKGSIRPRQSNSVERDLEPPSDSRYKLRTWE